MTEGYLREYRSPVATQLEEAVVIQADIRASTDRSETDKKRDGDGNL